MCYETFELALDGGSRNLWTSLCGGSVEKQCKECGAVKPIGDFYVRDGWRDTRCKPCYNSRRSGRQRSVTGDFFEVPHLSRSEIARVFQFVHVTSGCWLWTGDLVDGYGRISYQDRPTLAHRLIYAWLVEPLPTRQNKPYRDLDHICRVRPCVNPSHLDLVTIGENIRRGHLARNTSTAMRAQFNL